MNDLFDAVRPLRAVDPLTDDVRARAQARLLRASAARPVRRRVVLTGVVAAGAAAAIAIPIALQDPGVPPVPPAAVGTSASVFLNRVALAASTQTGPDARHAAYWYSESRDRQRPGDPWGPRQIWIGNERPGRMPWEGDLPTGADAKGQSRGDLEALEPGVFGAGPDGKVITWPDLWTLPTDPDALATYLRAGSAGAGSGPDAELFVVAGDMLRESPAPPDLRAALYRVMASVPGVRLVGEVTDGEGRRGVGVERDTGGSVQRYVVDPDTGFLLQESSGDYTAVYLEQGPVADDHTVFGG